MANGPQNIGEVFLKSLAAGVGSAAKEFPRQKDQQRQQLLENFGAALQLREARERSMLNSLTASMRQLQISKKNAELAEVFRKMAMTLPERKQAAAEKAQIEAAGQIAKSKAIQTEINGPTEILPSGELSFTAPEIGRRQGEIKKGQIEKITGVPIGDLGLQPTVTPSGQITMRAPKPLKPLTPSEIRAQGKDLKKAQETQSKNRLTDIARRINPDAWKNIVKNKEIPETSVGWRALFESDDFKPIVKENPYVPDILGGGGRDMPEFMNTIFQETSLLEKSETMTDTDFYNMTQQSEKGTIEPSGKFVAPLQQTPDFNIAEGFGFDGGYEEALQLLEK